MNPAAGEPTLPPRALVVVLRGLPLAFVGCYGNEWIRTPTLDRFADRGIACDSHFATAPAPADDWHVLADQGVVVRRVTVTERHWSLRGERAAAYGVCKSLGAVPALVVVQTDALLPPWQPPRKWLDYYLASLADEVDEPHRPWRGPLPDALDADDLDGFERIQGTFAAVVSAVDAALARLLAGCRSRGFGSNALIMITADAGLALGEHGSIGFGGVCEAHSHLPLLVRLPRHDQAGRRVSALTAPPDVMATLAEHFGRGGPTRDGMSLWPLFRGDEQAQRDHLVIRGVGETGIRTADRLAVFSDAPPRLYIKPDDRWEVNDLAAKMEGDVERLAALNPAAT